MSSADLGRGRQMGLRILDPVKGADRSDQDVVLRETQPGPHRLPPILRRGPVPLDIDAVIDGLDAPGRDAHPADVVAAKILGHSVQAMGSQGQQTLQHPPAPSHAGQILGEQAMDAVNHQRGAAQMSGQDRVEEGAPVVGVHHIRPVLAHQGGHFLIRMPAGALAQLINLYGPVSQPALEIAGLFQAADGTAKGLFVQGVDQIDHAVFQSPHPQGVDHMQHVDPSFAHVRSPSYDPAVAVFPSGRSASTSA